MGGDTEVELLRGQNRRLKVALFFIVAVLGVLGPVVATRQAKLAEEANRRFVEKAEELAEVNKRLADKESDARKDAEQKSRQQEP